MTSDTLIIGLRGEGKTVLNDRLTSALAKAHGLEVIAVRKEGSTGSALPSGTKFYTRPEPALEYIWERKPINYILSVSEAQDIAGSRAGMYDDRMYTLIFQGRHVGCTLILDTQRAARLHYDAFSEMENVFSFRQNSARDLDRIEEYAEDRGMDGRAARLAVSHLPDHAFYAARTGRVYRLTYP